MPSWAGGGVPGQTDQDRGWLEARTKAPDGVHQNLKVFRQGGLEKGGYRAQAELREQRIVTQGQLQSVSSACGMLSHL